MYKSSLPQCCVNVYSYYPSYYPSTCTSPCYRSAVPIRFFTTPLHAQVLTDTVMCQYGFLLPLYMYKSSLPQCSVNTYSYYPSTCTSPCCRSAVPIRFFTTPLYVQVFTDTVMCQYGFYYPSTCTSPHCHSAVSICILTTPLHVQFLTATVLC